jgi:hypothetical protein
MTRDIASTRAPRTGLAAGVAITVLLRIPGFLEPHWYSDESTYAYVGRTIFNGGVLYRSPGAWDNKPPVQYWMYGIVTHSSVTQPPRFISSPSRAPSPRCWQSAGALRG